MLTVTLIEDRPPLAVKEIKVITGNIVTLILPDFTDNGTLIKNAVYSLQPGGKDGWRPSGANGQYERACLTGNVAVLRPSVPGKPQECWGRFFAVVGTL